MAIQFARARYVSRSSGGSAIRSAAYNAREAIEAERTGELYYFKHRDAPEHHEVLLPVGADERFRDCEDAARDPAQVLAALTRNNATFSECELDRYLSKHMEADEERAAAKAAVLAHAELVALHDRATGETAERRTTRAVRAQEISALASGAATAGAGHHHAVAAGPVAAAAASRSLRDDQHAAFEHAVAAGGLKLIEGRAGTGKNYTLQAVREAHERAGDRVIGLAPTNAVAQDLGKEGFTEASTVHAALFRLKNGRTVWERRTVVVVDEAAMLDSHVMGELLDAARAAGAKVILAGDDRQLASIESAAACSPS